MPRKAREKSPESIYHIMCRSSTEILLFRDDNDKDRYLFLLKRYKDKYKCAIYAYCLMSNHSHLQLDGRGFDISKFMQSLNTAYVRYYNKKYNRRGHLFQERFESRIVDTDQYNFAVSAYIHNNPKDIEGYSGKEHLYPYSSYGIYLDIREDNLELVDQDFMHSMFGVRNHSTFIRKYKEFVLHQRDIGAISKIIEKLPEAVEYEYRSGRSVILRNHLPSKILPCISDRLIGRERGVELLKSKYKALNYRAFSAYVMRVLCGLSYREICENMYNITVSGCARLCDQGYDLVDKDGHYTEIFKELAGVAV